jgi:hypothetical protein
MDLEQTRDTPSKEDLPSQQESTQQGSMEEEPEGPIFTQI